MHQFSISNLLNQKEKNIIFFLIFNALIKLPSFYNSIDPFVFIDEFILWVEFERLVLNKTFLLEFFRVGGSLNFYPSLLIFMPLSVLFEYFDLTMKLTPVLVFSRLLLNIFASSLSLIFILKINDQVSLNKNNSSNTILALLFIFNPYLLGQTNQWYPDSYLYLFSTLCTYYMILIFKNIQYKKNTYKLFICLALGTSVKLTFFYFGFFVFLFFLSEFIKYKSEILITIIKASTLFLIIFSAFNISIYFKFEEFIGDLNFLLTNYGDRSLSNLTIALPFYFLYLFVVPVGIFGIIFLIYDLNFMIKEKKYFYLSVFYLMPFIYIFILSLYPVFLNRNINLFVPIILISLSRGIDNFYFKHKHNTNYFIFVPLIFFIAQIASFGITLHDDFKVDSRIQAYRWIVDNKIDKYPINTNDHLLADGIKEINDTVYIFNEINNENYDYYIVNGWGESDIVSVKFPNILFVQNHSNDHFRYINNKDYFSSNLFIQEKINSNEHELIARFKGNGPLIYIFKNK
jgi:hypothetical protein